MLPVSLTRKVSSLFQGVDPKLVQLQSGQLALTAGRVGLHLWLSDPAVQPRGKANLLKQLAKQAGGGWLEYAH